MIQIVKARAKGLVGRLQSMDLKVQKNLSFLGMED